MYLSCKLLLIHSNISWRLRFSEVTLVLNTLTAAIFLQQMKMDGFRHKKQSPVSSKRIFHDKYMTKSISHENEAGWVEHKKNGANLWKESRWVRKGVDRTVIENAESVGQTILERRLLCFFFLICVVTSLPNSGQWLQICVVFCCSVLLSVTYS